MKYRHQYHAGNFADVHKHVLLLEVLRALMRKLRVLLSAYRDAGGAQHELINLFRPNTDGGRPP